MMSYIILLIELIMLYHGCMNICSGGGKHEKKSTCKTLC